MTRANHTFVYSLLVALLLCSSIAAAATEPLTIFLRDNGDTCSVFLPGDTKIVPGDFQQLYERLRGWRFDPVDNPNGVYAHEIPVIIRPEPESKWRHIGSTLMAVRQAGYTNIAVSHARNKQDRTTLQYDKPVTVQIMPVKEQESSTLQIREDADLALIGVTGSKPLPAGVRQRKPSAVAGVGGMARDIVFVNEISESPEARRRMLSELKQSISDLKPPQRFQVILYRADKVIELAKPNEGLKPATPEAIEAAQAWLDPDAEHCQAASPANPSAALRQAIRYQPDLIYLIASSPPVEGEGALDVEALQQVIEAAKNTHDVHQLRINAIQVYQPDPHQLLRRIAKQNGGMYRFLQRP